MMELMISYNVVNDVCELFEFVFLLFFYDKKFVLKKFLKRKVLILIKLYLKYICKMLCIEIIFFCFKLK